MLDGHGIVHELWSRARFPSSGMRQEFLDQIGLWNRIEDLPTVEALPLADTCAVKFRCNDQHQRGLRLLIDSFGGEITFHLDGGVRSGLAATALGSR